MRAMVPMPATLAPGATGSLTFAFSLRAVWLLWRPEGARVLVGAMLAQDRAEGGNRICLLLQVRH